MKAVVDEIKALLEAATGRRFESALLNASVAVAGEPAKGSSNAKVMLVEVSDYRRQRGRTPSTYGPVRQKPTSRTYHASGVRIIASLESPLIRRPNLRRGRALRSP
jgi:hypothetical protein